MFRYIFLLLICAHVFSLKFYSGIYNERANYISLRAAFAACFVFLWVDQPGIVLCLQLLIAFTLVWIKTSISYYNIISPRCCACQWSLYHLVCSEDFWLSYLLHCWAVIKWFRWSREWILKIFLTVHSWQLGKGPCMKMLYCYNNNSFLERIWGWGVSDTANANLIIDVIIDITS